MTSNVRTQRHKAPRDGVSFLIRISASRIMASVYLPSVSAADMRAVRFPFSALSQRPEPGDVDLSIPAAAIPVVLA